MTARDDPKVLAEHWLDLVVEQTATLRHSLQVLGQSRAVSLALTKLDESELWAREHVRLKL